MAEDNGDVKDFKFLPPCGSLYVLLGIFHSFITKRPIPGSLEPGIDLLAKNLGK